MQRHHRRGAALGEVGESGLAAATAILSAECPQILVPAGQWQSARPAGDEHVLVSCVVSPGFEFADFHML
ncbi:cupin domain-containing protein [Micromonospora sp. NPDC049102]|uniref:cupin domain-containing protein n=1 Tax=Micromonospora sp. NPDC049102 TaxID=3364265 RepID=UPI00371DA08B